MNFALLWSYLNKPRNEVRVRRMAAKRRRLYAYLGPDVAMTQLYNGLFIYVDPLDFEISSQIIARGFWEIWVQVVVEKLLRPGDRVIEVGANIGYYTLLMADRIGHEGRLDSFEANPRLTRLLHLSVSMNGFLKRVTIHENAAADAAGYLAFVTSRHRSGSGHILAGAGDFGDESVHVNVEAVRLDDVVTDGPVDLIRIDAEGFEPQVLKGAQAIIARSPDIKICMEWDVAQMQGRASIDAFIDMLLAAGLKFWLIEFDSSISPLTREALMALPHRDVIAARAKPF